MKCRALIDRLPTSLARGPWLLRSVVVVVASSLFLAAALVGAAPAAWGVLNSHDLTPVSLPLFEGLASRSQILDVNGVQIGVFESENSQPLAIEDVPVDVIAALLHFVAKELAVRLPAFREADVMGLAQVLRV